MSKHIKIFSVLFVLFVSLASGLFLNSSVYSRDDYYKSDEFINVTVYERINPAIVLVEAQLLDGLSSGTGCVINKSGIILTSSHVIEDGKDITVTIYNGKTYKAEVLKRMGRNNDLALLKIKIDQYE